VKVTAPVVLVQHSMAKPSSGIFPAPGIMSGYCPVSIDVGIERGGGGHGFAARHRLGSDRPADEVEKAQFESDQKGRIT
jgi:hypothetical protein